MDQILIGNKQGDCNYFDDSVELMQHSPYKVKSLKMFFTSEALLGIQANYYSFKSQKIIKCPKHKAGKLFGVNIIKIDLKNDEYITHLEGHYTDKSIHRLQFKTDKDQVVQVGVTQGNSFDLKVPEGFQVGPFSGGISKFLCFLNIQLLSSTNQGNCAELQNNLDLSSSSSYSWQNYQIYLQWKQQSLLQQKEEQKEEPTQVIYSTFEYLQHVQVCEPRAISNKSEFVIQNSIESVLKLHKYIQFKIKILNQDGSLKQSCFRRYKDFAQFRELLVQKWPGIYIAPMPTKDMIKDFDQQYIETRRKYLEYFLLKVSTVPFFTDTVEFGLFTGRGKKIDDDIKQVYLQLKELTVKNLIIIYVQQKQPATKEQIKLRYLQTFDVLHKQPPVNETQRAKLNDFLTYLIRISQAFEQMVVLKNKCLLYRLVRVCS